MKRAQKSKHCEMCYVGSGGAGARQVGRDRGREGPVEATGSPGQECLGRRDLSREERNVDHSEASGVDLEGAISTDLDKSAGGPWPCKGPVVGKACRV